MLEKARFLLQTRHYREAEQEILRAITQNPNYAEAHSFLAVVQLTMGRANEALQSARRGVHLAPSNGHSHYILALVQLKSQHVEESQRSIREALRLNPHDPRYYEILSEIHLHKKQWNEAVQAAEEGLRIFPESVECLLLRSQALIALKRNEEARMALDTARSLNPENAKTNVLQGWLHLNQKRYPEAFTSFGEALRVNPNIELAQEGIVEAMKARNPVYRVMLNYYDWMSKLDGKTKFGVLIGGYIGIQILGRTLRDSPLFIPFILVYIGFIFLTWTSDILFDLLLRIDRFGRRALSKERRIASNWIGMSLLTGAVLAIAAVFISGPMQLPLFEAALKMCGLILPIAGIFQARSANGRNLLVVYSAGLLLATIWGLVAAVQGTNQGDARIVYVLGLIIYTWVGNIIITRR